MSEQHQTLMVKPANDEVRVYSIGICHASVCAPAGMEREVIEQKVTSKFPTGLDHGWTVSGDPTFNFGEPNPCQCNDDATRMHYLMEC